MSVSMQHIFRSRLLKTKARLSRYKGEHKLWAIAYEAEIWSTHITMENYVFLIRDAHPDLFFLCLTFDFCSPNMRRSSAWRAKSPRLQSRSNAQTVWIHHFLHQLQRICKQTQLIPWCAPPERVSNHDVVFIVLDPCSPVSLSHHLV